MELFLDQSRPGYVYLFLQLERRNKERKYIYLSAHLSKYIKKRNDITKVKKKKNYNGKTIH
jgi:hypothetical protein